MSLHYILVPQSHSAPVSSGSPRFKTTWPRNNELWGPLSYLTDFPRVWWAEGRLILRPPHMTMLFSSIFRGFRSDFRYTNVLVHNQSMLELDRRMPSKQSDNVGLWKPSKARYEFRTNPEWQGKTSSGFCMGYLQANLAILPSSLAKDFQRFCELNNAPCPLLYRSKTGELSAGFLAPDSDVRYNESSQP